jgi:hypothetical protein
VCHHSVDNGERTVRTEVALPGFGGRAWSMLILKEEALEGLAVSVGVIASLVLLCGR